MLNFRCLLARGTQLNGVKSDIQRFPPPCSTQWSTEPLFSPIWTTSHLVGVILISPPAHAMSNPDLDLVPILEGGGIVHVGLSWLPNLAAYELGVKETWKCNCPVLLPASTSSSAVGSQNPRMVCVATSKFTSLQLPCHGQEHTWVRIFLISLNTTACQPHSYRNTQLYLRHSFPLHLLN